MKTNRIMTAALLLWLPATVATGQTADFGMLLTTPEERAQLDRLRGRGPAPDGAADHNPLSSLAPRDDVGREGSPARTITLHGILKRSGGPEVVWINRSHTMSTPVTPEGVEVIGLTPDLAGARVRTGDGGEDLALRVGQSWDPARRATDDVFSQPTATPTPPPADPE